MNETAIFHLQLLLKTAPYGPPARFDPGLAIQAAVQEVKSIGLTVRNLDRELRFYTNTLPFELVGILEKSGKEQADLFGLPEAHLRVATLKMGNEQITLTEHVNNSGQPIPRTRAALIIGSNTWRLWYGTWTKPMPNYAGTR